MKLRCYRYSDVTSQPPMKFRLHRDVIDRESNKMASFQATAFSTDTARRAHLQPHSCNKTKEVRISIQTGLSHCL